MGRDQFITHRSGIPEGTGEKDRTGGRDVNEVVRVAVAVAVNRKIVANK